MSRLVLSLTLAACVPAGPAGPAADPRQPAAGPPTRDRPAASTDPQCLDLRGAPRRRLQAGPDGALWLEQWTRRPEPRGDLVRVDPSTGDEQHVLSDILSAHLAGGRLVAVRPIGDDRSVLRGRRGLFVAGLDGAGERPLSPPGHAVASYALARDAALYTTPDGALYRSALAGDRLEHLADGIAAVRAAWDGGDLLVDRADASGLAVLTTAGALRPLELAGDVSSAPGHVLIDSPSGSTLWPDGAASSAQGHVLIASPSGPILWPDGAAAIRLPSDLRPLPGAAVFARSRDGADVLHGFDGRALAPLAAVAGASVVEAVPVPEGIWTLVRHDTDADGVLRPLADEADLCRIGHGAQARLPARDRPRRLDRPPSTFAALAVGDLSGATAAIEAGVLVLRAPGPGPETLAALRARATAVHRDAARLAGGPDLDLALEWAGNHRRAAVSWDSRLARPAVVGGGHGLAAADPPVHLDHALHREPTPDGRHRLVCRGHVRHDAATARTLELRCAAHLRPGDGAPVAAAAIVLEDMPSRTAVPFAVDLGVHPLAPAAADIRVFDGPRELAAVDPAALADLDDFLAALDRAAALGFAPAPGRGHAAPRLAAPPGFADLPAREQTTRAAALWEILAAHADRHHHGRLAPVHLAGTTHTIRRGRLE